MGYLRNEIKMLREGGLHCWWYGRKGITYCASAIIGKGHMEDFEGNPVAICPWCGMTEEYAAWVAKNGERRKK